MIPSTQSWHIEDILGLTSYSMTATEAQRFARRERWKDLGYDGTHIWGTLLSNAGTPYRDLQVGVNLSNIRINSGGMVCECRSQMPCTHVVGLLLLMMQDEAAFKVGKTPDYVRDKIFARLLTVRPPDEAFADIERGLMQLERWLRVLIRDGLAQPQVRTFEFWDDMAGRILSAWMPGLSQWLRDTAVIAVRSREWVEPVLEDIGRMYLLARSFDRYTQLPSEAQADIRDAIGWQLPEFHLSPPQRDQWVVLGQRQRLLLNRVPEQITWLYGRESKRMAVIQSFGSHEVLQTVPFVVGQTIDADLAYLPSRVPLKAQVVMVHGTKPREAIAGVSIGQAVEQFGQAIARNPWLRHYPVVLDDVYVSRFHKHWTLRHSDGTYLPLAAYFQHKWVLHGAHGGRPIQVAAVWDGRALFPLSAVTGEGFINLNQIIPYTKR